MNEETKSKTNFLHGKKVNIMTTLNEGESITENNKNYEKFEKLPEYDEVTTGKYTDLVIKEKQEREKDNSNIRFHHMMVIHNPPPVMDETVITEAVNEANKVKQNLPKKVELNEKDIA